MNTIDKVLDQFGLYEFYSLNSGPNSMFIAGGACTRMVRIAKLIKQNPTLPDTGFAPLGKSDLDIWCNDEYRAFLQNHLIESGCVVLRSGELVTTMYSPFVQTQIQLIKMRIEDNDSIMLTLKTFDLSASKIAYVNGQTIWGSDEDRILLDKGLLRVYCCSNTTEDRFLKYLTRYNLQPDYGDAFTSSLVSSIKARLSGVTNSNMSSLYSGGDVVVPPINEKELWARPSEDSYQW